MTKEFVLPQGVNVIDGVLYFGDHQVSCHGKPYKFAHIPTMATMFAIRYTNERTSYPTLCTTLDIDLVEKGSDQTPYVWFCGARIIGGKHLPSAYYPYWKSVEYILNNLTEELQGSKWFIEVDDINSEYVWDNEKGVFRRQIAIETVEYIWDDEQ